MVRHCWCCPVVGETGCRVELRAIDAMGTRLPLTAVDPTVAAAARRRWGTTGIALIGIAGLVVLLYPTITSWFSAKAQESALQAYVERVDAIPDAAKAAVLTAADDYNAAIPEILLTDPFTADDTGTDSGSGGAYQVYLDHLAFDGVEVMGRVRIPTIAVDLPILHGTEEATLERGVGHVFGSSLPVGGIGTHSVLTAHSGLITAVMFDELEQLRPGDTVQIDVLDRSLHYRVTSTQVVLPTEVSDLQLAVGRDQITLVTCTPTGVNTHRLLVHADRVPIEGVAADTGRTVLTDAPTAAGFPWWIPVLIGGSVLVWAAVLWLDRSARRNRSV